MFLKTTIICSVLLSLANANDLEFGAQTSDSYNPHKREYFPDGASTDLTYLHYVNTHPAGQSYEGESSQVQAPSQNVEPKHHREYLPGANIDDIAYLQYVNTHPAGQSYEGEASQVQAPSQNVEPKYHREYLPGSNIDDIAYLYYVNAHPEKSSYDSSLSSHDQVSEPNLDNGPKLNVNQRNQYLTESNYPDSNTQQYTNSYQDENTRNYNPSSITNDPTINTYQFQESYNTGNNRPNLVKALHPSKGHYKGRNNIYGQYNAGQVKFNAGFNNLNERNYESRENFQEQNIYPNQNSHPTQKNHPSQNAYQKYINSANGNSYRSLNNSPRRKTLPIQHYYVGNNPSQSNVPNTYPSQSKYGGQSIYLRQNTSLSEFNYHTNSNIPSQTSYSGQNNYVSQNNQSPEPYETIDTKV